MERKKMKSIKLCFENVEVVEVPAECVANFLFENIHLGVFNDWHSENATENEVAKHVLMILKPAGDIPLTDTGNAKTLFERITKFNDLVSAEIIYEDDMSREIGFHWHKNDEYSNRYQSSYKTKNNYLIIVVHKKKKAKDFKDVVEK